MVAAPLVHGPLWTGWAACDNIPLIGAAYVKQLRHLLLPRFVCMKIEGQNIASLQLRYNPFGRRKKAQDSCYACAYSIPCSGAL